MPRPLFQFPNKELVAALLSRGVAIALGEEAGRGAADFSTLALLAWSYEEATDGANWFRNLIGLGGVAYSVRELVTRR